MLMLKRLKEIWRDTIKRHIRRWKPLGGLSYGS